jgi:hypothetical protein
MLYLVHSFCAAAMPATNKVIEFLFRIILIRNHLKIYLKYFSNKTISIIITPLLTEAI